LIEKEGDIEKISKDFLVWFWGDNTQMLKENSA